MPPDVCEEELKASADATSSSGSRLSLEGNGALGRLGRWRWTDLQPNRLQLAGERLDVVFGEIVLEHKRLELGGFDVSPLLSGLEQDASLVAI